MNLHLDRPPIILLITLFVGGLAIDKLHSNEEVLNTDSKDYGIDYRLPKTIIPTLYEIMLMPDLEETFDFTGIVKITATVREPTDKVVFHCGQFAIASTAVTIDDTKVAISEINHDPVTDKYVIYLRETLQPGTEITIALTYSSELRDDMIGFYKSSYVDAAGNIKWLAATQFQATHARHAFPCFDEPSFKASFTISIRRSAQFKSLSNMPLRETVPVDDEFWDIFEQSIPMSTYLVAFIVSEFDSLPNGNMKVWAKPEVIAQGAYALSIGSQALEYLSDLFQQEYQLPKMDMVAVPDFAAGAMENWGLVTYRESGLLYDPDQCSAVTQQSIAAVIVHELTHMWFGNQITPAWWSYLWLSEAFARYFQYHATAQIEASWNYTEQFVVEQHQPALGVDGLETSQPMTRETVSSQSEIGGMGDAITYSKGASILRMMNRVFGSDIFYAGLRNYLEYNKKDGLGYPDNLWSVFQDQVNTKNFKPRTSVKNIMSTWTTQAGYPVVTVSIDEQGVATLNQRRFLLRNLKSTSTRATWWVPLTWTTQSDGNFLDTTTRYWLNAENDTIYLDVKRDDWVIFNVQSSGFYRVNYDTASWYKIFDTLRSSSMRSIPVLSRANIVDDLLNLARAGLLSYEVAIDGIQYLIDERNYLPYKAALNAFEYLDRKFLGHQEHYTLKRFMLLLTSITHRQLGFEDRIDADRLSILLRRDLNKWACRFDDKKCVAVFKAMFKEWKQGKLLSIGPNFRIVAYCTGIKYGNEHDWELLWNEFYHSNNAADQIVIIEALGCTQNTTILERYLLNAISGYATSRIRKQDSKSVFSAVYKSGLVGAELILDFVSKYHEKMKQYFGDASTIAGILASASEHFSTQELVDKFESLIETHQVEFKSILGSLKNSLEIAKYELLWYRQNVDSIERSMNSFIDKHTSTTAVPTSTVSTLGPSIPSTASPIDSTVSNLVSVTTSGTTISSTFSTISITPTTVPSTPSPAPTTPPIGDDSKKYRLPLNILPYKYIIDVHPLLQPEIFTFNGYVQIFATVKKATQTIVLHSVEIKHHHVSVSSKDKQFNVVKVSIEEKYNIFTIELDKELPAELEIQILIKYSGILNTEMRGFYRSSYMNEHKRTRWLAATHLEPVGARKMFPCFDEPALKASFLIKVTVPKEYSAISNMPVKSVTGDMDGKKSITFEETPKMSTYLVALVVSDFTSISDEKNNFGVWARSNAIDQTKYALDRMYPILRFFEKRLNITYKLPKLDMVALPDFAAGAMENWGLLTYKEKNLLYDERDSDVASKQITANIISHEIAHQWFGNLVTPLWWKYLWLSEGFARYFQYFGIGHGEVETNLEDQFVVDQVQSVFITDGSSSTHAMTHDVSTPAEIRGIFDSISYAKAASVLRMINKTFGSDIFYKALRRYLEKCEYNVATPDDLFGAFREEIGEPEIKNSIYSIMNGWTTKPGYPLVHVSVEGNMAKLRQDRFFIRYKKNNDFVWHIPITWASKRNPTFTNTAAKYWLKETEATIDLKTEGDDLVIFNVQEAGYYRVNYDHHQWENITKYLKSKDFAWIHEVNRASLIDDALNLARAEYVDYETALSLTQYLTQEAKYLPWRAFFNGISYVQKRLQGNDAYNAFERYIRALVGSIYEHIGFNDKPTDLHTEKLLRMYVRKWACEFNIADCEKYALMYFDYWQRGKMLTVPPNYRSVSYCTAIKRNSPTAWRILWATYEASQVTAEKMTVLDSFACTTRAELLRELMKKAITVGSGIRYQDSLGVFSNIYGKNPEGASAVMDFIKDYYDNIVQYYGGNANIKSVVSGLASMLTSRQLYEEFDNLIKWLCEKEPLMKSTFESYKIRAHYELSWTEKHVPSIHKWLGMYYSNTEPRLPLLFHPEKYNIKLTPYFEEKNFAFFGVVEIEANVDRKDNSRIVLNVHQLSIDQMSVYEKIPGGNGSEVVKNELDILAAQIIVETQQLEIYLKNFITANTIIVTIKYSGILNDNMKGFYRSYYFDRTEGYPRWIATTHLEPVYARRVFPCFDEPAFKATFKIQVERQSNYSALSNMPLENSTLAGIDGRVLDTFKETPKMSTYLIAVVVSDFKAVRHGYEIVNVWGRSDIAARGDLAQIAAMRMLDYLFIETGYQYTLPKLDLIGIPDFEMGAMENWGLATFREYALFYDNHVTSAKYTNYLITIIAHELAHMWFGNLVTCDWWEYIWLNEGFAEYMQWHISDMFRPSHNFKNRFVSDELQPALLNDDIESSHPMNNPVSKPSEIAEIFDGITYGKASSVIRMLRNSLDSSVFPTAITKYIHDNKYGTTTPKNLWNAFDYAIQMANALDRRNISTAELMDAWTNEPGYPVVTANVDYQTLTLSQEYFYISGRRSEKESTFWIPITIATESQPQFFDTKAQMWLNKKPLQLFLQRPDEWLIVNVQQTGFYRVNYDLTSWDRIIKTLQGDLYTSIHVTNRAQVIDDLFNLARADYTKYSIAFEASKYLTQETEYPPWRSFFNSLNYVTQRYEGQKNREYFEKYIQILTYNLSKKLGFEDNNEESFDDKLTRELILSWACKYNQTFCVDTALKLFSSWRDGQIEGILPNAKLAVYCTAMRHGTDVDWQFLWHHYQSTQYASEKKIILDALGCTLSKDLIHFYIGQIFNENYVSNVRRQDVSAALNSIINSGESGVNVMLDYLIENYSEVYEFYKNWEGVASLFSRVASRVSTVDQIRKFEMFLEANKDKLKGILPALNTAVATMQANFYWFKRHSIEIDAWLEGTLQAYVINNNNGNAAGHNSPNFFFSILISAAAYLLHQ